MFERKIQNAKKNIKKNICNFKINSDKTIAKNSTLDYM